LIYHKKFNQGLRKMGDRLEQAREQHEFITRGLAGRDEAMRTNVFYSSEQVLATLRAMLDASIAERAETQKRLEEAFGVGKGQSAENPESQ
jgi:hypothetical protein